MTTFEDPQGRKINRIAGVLTGVVALCGAGILGTAGYLQYTQRNKTEETLPAIVRFYEAPKVLIGYDRWDRVTESFDPQNRTPQPSKSVLQDELQVAQQAQKQYRVESIQNALKLVDLCIQQKIPYMLASLAHNEPYNGMFQRESFPTTLVYCLPTIDVGKAGEVESGHEYAWLHQKTQKTDVQSYQYNGRSLEKIVAGEK